MNRDETDMETTFKPVNKTDTRFHDDWIVRFCVAGEGCPRSEFKIEGGWPINRAFCKETGRDVDAMDVERCCPRRDELIARRHAENGTRKKAKARARREFDAAHPRVKEPIAPAPPQDVATLLKGIPDAAPANHFDLF
jgi:hypothetical protein